MCCVLFVNIMSAQFLETAFLRDSFWEADSWCLIVHNQEVFCTPFFFWNCRLISYEGRSWNTQELAFQTGFMKVMQETKVEKMARIMWLMESKEEKVERVVKVSGADELLQEGHLKCWGLEALTPQLPKEYFSSIHTCYSKIWPCFLNSWTNGPLDDKSKLIIFHTSLQQIPFTQSSWLLCCDM